jgi:hypothetical protein
MIWELFEAMDHILCTGAHKTAIIRGMPWSSPVGIIRLPCPLNNAIG